MKKIINVPYFSQYTDLKDKYLALTSCGMMSLYMVLEYYKLKGLLKKTLPCPEEMVITGRETINGYKPGIGWIHQYFVDVAKNYGIFSERKEKLPNFLTIKKALDDEHPIVISVERRCLSGVSFHMVVITGYEEDTSGNIINFFYNDPAFLEEKDGKERICSIEQMQTFWRNKVIFFSA